LSPTGIENKNFILYFPYMPGVNFTYHPQFFTATILECPPAGTGREAFIN
jgi:hypothetical protein